MDAGEWRTSADVFDSFFRAVGAPEWHGRNFDALNDSIVSGGINRIEVPYVLAIANLDAAGASALTTAEEFIGFVRETESKGCPVSIVVRNERKDTLDADSFHA